MKNISVKQLKPYRVLFAALFLAILSTEEIIAQFIENQNARMDVRGTSRRTARRVNRRHDRWQSGGEEYAEPAPAPAAAPAAAAAATVAVLASLPAGCVDQDGLFNCNGTFYQPQMQGSNVVYVQVPGN